MPIISINDNPPSQFQKKPITDIDGFWWIAKVKPQQEKKFAFDLIVREIEYYLPYYTKVTKRSDGKFRKSSLVLFPSYIPFISEKPYSLLSTNRIVTILPVVSQKQFKTQLNQIWLISNMGVQLNPVDYDVKIKDRVKIITGPLSGISGEVVKIQGESSILLRVDAVGCVTISVDVTQIIKVGSL